jgi:hypothetical protein
LARRVLRNGGEGEFRARSAEWKCQGCNVPTPRSFKAVLRKYEQSSPSSDDRAHLQRWADHDRAEEVWHKIERAAQKNNVPLPPEYFITEILVTRRVAIALGHRRELREPYRNAAREMMRIARFLRQRHPHGMPPYPSGAKLADMCLMTPPAIFGSKSSQAETCPVY